MKLLRGAAKRYGLIVLWFLAGFGVILASLIGTSTSILQALARAFVGGRVMALVQTFTGVRQVQLMEQQAARARARDDAETLRLEREVPDIRIRAEWKWEREIRELGLSPAYRQSLLVEVRNVGTGRAQDVDVSATRQIGPSETKRIGPITPGAKDHAIFPLTLTSSNQSTQDTLGRTVTVSFEGEHSARRALHLSMTNEQPPRWSAC